MTSHDVIKKLIGPIEPVGETHTDEKRFSNLKETIELVEALLLDIQQVAESKDRAEYSMSKSGKYADKFLANL